MQANELAETRQQIAFAAHTGDQGARKKLDAINQQSSLHASELESVDAAISEATDRLEGARKDEAIAADRSDAHKLRKVLQKFCEHSAKLDAALSAAVTETQGMRETLNLMHSLGSDFPSHAQLDTLGALAMLTAMGRTPFHRSFEHLAPNQRRTFTELVKGWCERIEPEISQRLGEQEAA
jgi:hypothetical protein